MSITIGMGFPMLFTAGLFFLSTHVSAVETLADTDDLDETENADEDMGIPNSPSLPDKDPDTNTHTDPTEINFERGPFIPRPRPNMENTEDNANTDRPTPEKRLVVEPDTNTQTDPTEVNIELRPFVGFRPRPLPNTDNTEKDSEHIDRTETQPWLEPDTNTHNDSTTENYRNRIPFIPNFFAEMENGKDFTENRDKPKPEPRPVAEPDTNTQNDPKGVSIETRPFIPRPRPNMKNTEDNENTDKPKPETRQVAEPDTNKQNDPKGVSIETRDLIPRPRPNMENAEDSENTDRPKPETRPVVEPDTNTQKDPTAIITEQRNFVPRPRPYKDNLNTPKPLPRAGININTGELVGEENKTTLIDSELNVMDRSGKPNAQKSGPMVGRGSFFDNFALNELARGLGQMFETTQRQFASIDFTRMVPPKLRRISSDTMDDLMQSFKDRRLEEVFRKMLPRKRAEDNGARQAAELDDDSGFNFTSLPECHVRRLVQDLGKLPDEVQDKIIGSGRLGEMGVYDIEDMFPTNIFPSFTKKKFDEIRKLTADQINALCKRLLMTSSTPWNLQAAINGGINCLGSIKKLTTKKFLSKPQRLILMDHIRENNASSELDAEVLTSLFTRLGSVLKPSDIESFPTEVFKESLSNITKTRLPYRSQRRALLRKIKKDFGNPVAWPDNVLEKIGGLVDDMGLFEISYLRKNHIINAEGSLRSTMKSFSKRLALAKYMGSSTDQWKDSQDTESIKRSFPWLKPDRSYLDNLNLTNLLEALSARDHLTQGMRPGEVSLLASRLMKLDEFQNISDISSEQVDALGELLDGFHITFFNKLSDEALQNSTVIPRMLFSSKSKARAVLKRMRTRDQIGNLFNNIGLTDIRRLDPESVVKELKGMDKISLDQALARQIIEKTRELDKGQDMIKRCFWSEFRDLEDIAGYIPSQMILEGKFIQPPTLDTNNWPSCKCAGCEKGLTKPQVYAAFEMIKQSGETSGRPDYNADFFERIGRLALGMSAEDIKKLPENTELLTIIEILSDFEDEMDSSQVEALATKIREFFDIGNRKELDEVTGITVSQIGRFLQYLDVQRDLPKFPKDLRIEIAKEIGRSKMNKISSGKKNDLLQFALKNTKTAGGNIEDLTRASELDETAIEDLGYLRCGMRSDEINKLTVGAIDENIEEMQLCPFKGSEARALVKRALFWNVNRIKRQELLVGIGALLPYVTEEDLATAHEGEMAAVSEYIVELIDKRDKEIEIRENNGFIRERTAADKQESLAGKKRVMLKLKSVLQSVTNNDQSNNCHILRSLGPKITEISQTIEYSEQQEACSDEIGNLPNWDRNVARRRLESMAQLNFVDLEDMIDNMTPEMIRQNAGLIKGLTPTEIRRLTLNATDVMAAIGEFDGYTADQLLAAFEGWKHQTGKSNLSVDDIMALKNFVCGMPRDEMRSMVEPSAVKETVDALGRLTTCSPKQLEVLASKLADDDGFGSDAKQWKMWAVAAAGHIIGGLSDDQLSKLTTKQIQAVEPATISKMPVKKVKGFSTDQLSAFSTNQKNAITSMQRSYMTEEQMAAINVGSVGANGKGGEKTGASKLLLGLLLLVVASGYTG